MRKVGSAGNPLARVTAKVFLGFDRQFYLNQYPDVAEAGADPLQHYLVRGRSEGRAPSQIALVRQTREKKRSSSNFVAHAKARIFLGFDRKFYLKQYPDVAAAGLDPLQHYLIHGRSEGRAASRAALARPGQQTYAAPDLLRLSDLCDPHHEEPGPRFSDEAFLVTVLTPTFNTDPRYIRELYLTLVNQSYSNWEWVVVDDGSSRTASIAILRDMARRDPRVRFFANPVNLGISGASNVGLAAAQGTHVALVDHDDLVSRHAFYAVYEAWKQIRIHSFSLRTSASCSRTEACPNCGLNRTGRRPISRIRCALGTSRSTNLVSSANLGAFAQNMTAPKTMTWRFEPRSCAPTSCICRSSPICTARSRDRQPWLYEKSWTVPRQGKAVLDYARHIHAEAQVVPGWGGGYWRIIYPLPSPTPLLSFVIPTGGGSKIIRGKSVDLIVNCIRSFEAKAFYPNREYIVVHNGDLTTAQVQALESISRVKLILYSAPSSFNLSEKLNQGVAAAQWRLHLSP